MKNGEMSVYAELYNRNLENPFCLGISLLIKTRESFTDQQLHMQ